MATVEQLRTKLQYANKRVAFAWAKYYTEVNQGLHNDWAVYERYERVAEDVAIPLHIKEEIKAMALALKKKWECPVCLEMIQEDSLEITNCGHYLCKGCLEGVKEAVPLRETKWACPICRRKHNLKKDEEKE